MIDELHINGFRGLDDVHLGSLGQINLIVGPVNAGKTNLLEAVFLFCSNGDPSLLYKVLKFRRIDPTTRPPKEIVNLLDWFWSAETGTHRCEIRGSWMGAGRHVCISRLEQETMIPVRQEYEDLKSDQQEGDLRGALAEYQIETLANGNKHVGHLYVKSDRLSLKAAKVPNIPGRFVSVIEHGNSQALASVWTAVEDCGEEESVIGFLKLLDPDIKGVRVAADEMGHASLRVHHKTIGRMPLEFLGSGFGKALAIACYVVAAKNGILIIDEFDASLHIAAQSQLIEYTVKAVKKHNVQLFVSTHSLETLDAFLDQYMNASDLWTGPEAFRVFQLRKADTRTEVTSIDGDKAKRLRRETGFDLRRTA